jgi:hypothetical protein
LSYSAAFGLVELQGAGVGVQDVVGNARDVALLQPDVPVGADPGQDRDLFAPQSWHAPPTAACRQACLGGGDLGAPGGEELADLGSVVHVLTERRP